MRCNLEIGKSTVSSSSGVMLQLFVRVQLNGNVESVSSLDNEFFIIIIRFLEGNLFPVTLYVRFFRPDALFVYAPGSLFTNLQLPSDIRGGE